MCFIAHKFEVEKKGFSTPEAIQPGLRDNDKNELKCDERWQKSDLLGCTQKTRAIKLIRKTY